jgi:hypothetical protein
MDNLPSIGNMFKLIVVLILALIAISIILEIVKVLLPIAFIIAVAAGVYYLYQKMQENGKAKRV